MDAQQRLEKKVEVLLRENEKLKNDIKANRKLYSAAGAGPSSGVGAPNNFHSAMIGKGIMDKYGGVNKSTVLGAGAFSAGVGGLLGKGDGSGTDRSTYAFPTAGGYLNTPAGGVYGNPPTILGPREDKSFVSPGGHTHGAVSGLNLHGAGLLNKEPSTAALDNSYVMKNILNTPSSGKSKSGISE